MGRKHCCKKDKHELSTEHDSSDVEERCDIRRQSYFVNVCSDSVKLFIQDYGPIDAHTTIVMPDGNISPQGFTYQITPLVEAGFRVVIVNPRGMGVSDKPFEPYGLDVWADDLRKVIEKLDLQNIVLVGSTPLSRISLRYITRHGCDRVSCLFFHAPNANPTVFPSLLPLPLLQGIRADIQVNRENVVDTLTTLIFAPIVPTPAQRAWINDLQLQLPIHAWLGFIDSLIEDMTPELAGVCAPVLGIVGQFDLLTPVPAAQLFINEVPDGELIIVPAQGHLIQITAPTEYNNALINFALSCNAKTSKQNCQKTLVSGVAQKLVGWKNSQAILK